MASVTLQNIEHVYANGVQALNHLNLPVNEGEFVVLVGASGCGKSTALRLLAGLETPTAGDILLDGRSVTALSSQQRNIAMVFQNYSLYPHMSVKQNLEFPLKMQKLPRPQIKQRVEEAVELLQLQTLLHQKPKQLSGGQSQRVAIGRAIVRHPSVFLMDEPLSNLDANLRANIRSEIAKLQKQLNVTTIYVTHDQTEAMTLGDRVAILNQGELQQYATPQHLYQHPSNRFVAQFLGNPGMNVSPCLVEYCHDHFEIIIAETKLTLPRNDQTCRLESWQQQQLYLGIRPETLSLSVEKDIGLEVIVTSVELLGHEKLWHVQIGHQPHITWTVRQPASIDVQPGQTLKLNLPTNALYFFDQHGDAILNEPV